MKVKMKDNLILRYQQSNAFDYRERHRLDDSPINELQFVKLYEVYREYFKLKSFLKSIENKIIDVVFIHQDAFEEQDNNYWLPNELWNKL